MEFDLVNSLEQQYYTEGYEEGQQESSLDSYREGKEYGLQTGFQKFLLLGQIQAFADLIEPVLGVECGSHLKQLKELIDSVNFDNDYDTVIAMDKTISKIRNKVRILSTLAGKKLTLQQMEELGDIITGLDEEQKAQVNLTDLGNEGVW